MNAELSLWSGYIRPRRQFIASCANTTRASSQSHDLNVATEAKLWSHYFQLVGICNVLILAIQSAGPSRVGTLATYAASLSHSFADAQHALAITTAARDLRGASAAH